MDHGCVEKTFMMSERSGRVVQVTGVEEEHKRTTKCLPLAPGQSF